VGWWWLGQARFWAVTNFSDSLSKRKDVRLKDATAHTNLKSSKDAESEARPEMALSGRNLWKPSKGVFLLTRKFQTLHCLESGGRSRKFSIWCGWAEEGGGSISNVLSSG
jgi:hypothetical protein